jgi:hypothetical protein
MADHVVTASSCSDSSTCFPSLNATEATAMSPLMQYNSFSVDRYWECDAQSSEFFIRGVFLVFRMGGAENTPPSKGTGTKSPVPTVTA